LYANDALPEKEPIPGADPDIDQLFLELEPHVSFLGEAFLLPQISGENAVLLWLEFIIVLEFDIVL
jgi:hypothetical protein